MLYFYVQYIRRPETLFPFDPLTMWLVPALLPLVCIRVTICIGNLFLVKTICNPSFSKSMPHFVLYCMGVVLMTTASPCKPDLMQLSTFPH